VLCEQAGRITMATIRDHIIPLADGGTEDDSNTQALCWTCNELKRQTEAKSGRAKQAKVTTR
jgi:5-methylcytosine-specific restriction protein A